MSKLYNKPIEVRMTCETISAFFWRGRWLRVESAEKIERRGSWWEIPPGETYRIKAYGGGLYDLVKDKAGWVLERVWD